MSYDLYLVRVDTKQENLPSVIFDMLGNEGCSPPNWRDELRDFVAELCSLRPDAIVEFRNDNCTAIVTFPNTVVELLMSEGGNVGTNLPFHEETFADGLKLLSECFPIFEKRGFVIFDPQQQQLLKSENLLTDKNITDCLDRMIGRFKDY